MGKAPLRCGSSKIAYAEVLRRFPSPCYEATPQGKNVEIGEDVGFFLLSVLNGTRYLIRSGKVGAPQTARVLATTG